MLQKAAGPLVQLERAKRLLAEARSLDEIKAIRHQAEAMRDYARAAKLGLDVQNQAAEIKLRAERKAGACLAQLQLHGGDRKTSDADRKLRLKDLGISYNESKRWQLAASVQESDFNQYVERVRQLGEEITAAGLFRLAKQQHRNGNGQHTKANSVPARYCEFTQEELDEIASKESTYLILEVRNHLGVLDQVLRPIYENQTGEQLKNGERRAIGRLMREMDAIFKQLEKQLT